MEENYQPEEGWTPMAPVYDGDVTIGLCLGDYMAYVTVVTPSEGSTFRNRAWSVILIDDSQHIAEGVTNGTVAACLIAETVMRLDRRGIQ